MKDFGERSEEESWDEKRLKSHFEGGFCGIEAENGSFGPNSCCIAVSVAVRFGFSIYGDLCSH